MTALEYCFQGFFFADMITKSITYTLADLYSLAFIKTILESRPMGLGKMSDQVVETISKIPLNRIHLEFPYIYSRIHCFPTLVEDMANRGAH